MAAPLPFISTTDLGDYIGGDADNAKGTIVVDAACDMCRTISEQTFTLVTSETATLDGTGTEFQPLPQYPPGTVITVSEDGTALGSTDWVLDRATGALIRVPAEQGYISSNTTLAPSVVWNRGRRNIEVIYGHGWTPLEFPTDVRLVALSIAERLYQQGPGVFESLGARSVRYDGMATDLTANESRILSKYKRY